jgi:peptidoglycan/xylan/chitin deacetylase (PgdA/CDA1 family)
MRFFSAPATRRRLMIAAAFLLVAVCAGLYFDRYRKVPIERALSPVWWVRHWRGLDRYDASKALLEHGDPSVPEVALTIDDGPDPIYGPAIAQYLHDAQVPATFFLVGKRVKQFPQVAKLLADDGFELGDHTYDHQRLSTLNPRLISNEITFCAKDIKDVTGRDVSLLRPPGVQYTDDVLKIARSLGYVTVSWTCGARDYDDQPAPYIAQRVIDRTEAGSIILLHQDHSSTAGALPIIVKALRARGYRFVTISQMLDRLHARRPTVQPAG